LSNTKKFSSCIVGVGDAGSRITMGLSNRVNSDYLLLTNSALKSINSDKVIQIDTGNIINPSPEVIRKSFLESSNDIFGRVCEFQSIILIGNLASRFGSSILPMLAQLIRKKTNIQIVCLLILPFSFEKEKLFRCGVSLSMLSRYIENILVIDNDAVIRNDLDLSLEEHFNLTNQVISDIVIESLNKTFPSKFNFVTTSRINSSKIKDAFIDTMSALTEKINLSEIQRYSLYLFQSSENVSVIKNLVESSNSLLPTAQQDINLILNGNGQTRCHVLATTDHRIVSLYDPLNFLIPKDNVLDFEPEIAINEGVKLDYIKDLESSLLV
jgi:cell division protein FtsZ